MSKYTQEVISAANALEAAEIVYDAAVKRLEAVRNHNGQLGYSIAVNGHRIDVSVCDSKTYQGTLIRGREMMHLGALKALGAEVDHTAKRVNACRKHLSNVVTREAI
jgi:hypothetical protein